MGKSSAKKPVHEVTKTPSTQETVQKAGSAALQDCVERVQRRVSHDFEVPSPEPVPLRRNSTYEGNMNELDSAAAAARDILSKPAGSDLNEMQLVGGVGAVVGVWVGLGGDAAHWLVIIACLVTTAVCALGLSTVQQMRRDLQARTPAASWLAVPLTGKVLDLTTVNKFANSCQVREKGLKIVQYILKLGAYCKCFPAGTTKALKELSKATSIARRFFKFCRWIKHFEDISEAKGEKNGVMRGLLYLRLGANIGADWAEDVCSLERIGFLPKGTLSVEFMLFAEYCQLVLALVEIWVTSVRARKEQEVTEAAALVIVDDKSRLAVAKQQTKLTLVRLELIKFVSDVGKAIYDCELSIGHEGVFIGCSLFSGIISTHKNMVKVLK